VANLFSDNFNRADSTDLGASWTERIGDWAINGNRVWLSADAASDGVVHTAAYSTSDYTVAAIVNFLNTAGISARIAGRRVNYGASDSNYYFVQLRRDLQEIHLYKRVSGSFTQLGSTVSVTVNVGTDYVVKLHMQGTTIKAFLDEVEKISVTDSALAGPGDAGISVYALDGQDIKFDDFTVDDLAAGGNWGPLLGLQNNRLVQELE